VLLLTGAALLIQSLWRLQRVNSGLHPENILTFDVTLPEVKYKSGDQSQFFIDLKRRLESTPGVQSASSILPLPLSGERFGISFEIEGRPLPPKATPSPAFFA